MWSPGIGNVSEDTKRKYRRHESGRRIIDALYAGQAQLDVNGFNHFIRATRNLAVSNANTYCKHLLKTFQ